MKICVSEGQTLPQTFSLRIIGRPLVFRVRQIWRTKHQVGAAIEGIVKRPAPASAPALMLEHAQEPDRHHGLGRHVRYAQNG